MTATSVCWAEHRVDFCTGTASGTDYEHCDLYGCGSGRVQTVKRAGSVEPHSAVVS